MLRLLSCIVIFLAVFGPAQSAVRKLPSYIVACSRGDPKLNQCIKDHGNDAIPKLKDGDNEFKISPINPLKINEAILEPGANLKLVMRNIDAIGLDQLRILDADINLDTNILKLNLELPHLQLLGDYEVDGKILIVPISGKGKANITLENVNNIKYELHLDEKTKNGQNCYIVKDNTVKFNDIGKAYFIFLNLFNGDERLGSEMNTFLNENWKEILKEFNKSLEDIIASIIKNFVQQILQNVPTNQVFLP